jgi:hypothetical protein
LSSKLDRKLVYEWKAGTIMTGLTVIEYLLANEGPGDGGFRTIDGSHKANLRPPPGVVEWERWQHLMRELNGRADSAIIFSETCTHGTLP